MNRCYFTRNIINLLSLRTMNDWTDSIIGETGIDKKNSIGGGKSTYFLWEYEIITQI